MSDPGGGAFDTGGIVTEVVREHGPGILDDRRRCRGLVLDALGEVPRQHRPLVRAVLVALADGVPLRLVAHATVDAEAAQLAQRAGVDPADARPAVDTWARAVGLAADGPALAVTPISSAAAPPVAGAGLRPSDLTPDLDLRPLPGVAPAPSAPGTPAVSRPGSRRRTLLLGGAGAAALLLVFVAVPAYAHRGIYVGFDGNRVAIFRGDPDGFLWVDAEIERTTGLSRSDVPRSGRADLDDGIEVDDLAAAEALLDDLQADRERDEQLEAQAAAQAELNRFSFVQQSTCQPSDHEGPVVELVCTQGPFTTWFAAWPSDRAMADYTDDWVEYAGWFSEPWNDGIDVLGDLVTFSSGGQNYVYWTYEDTFTVPVSVLGTHSGNDPVVVRDLWSQNALRFEP